MKGPEIWEAIMEKQIRARHRDNGKKEATFSNLGLGVRISGLRIYGLGFAWIWGLGYTSTGFDIWGLGVLLGFGFGPK